MKSGKLPQLIQGMYGAVLGVSIVRFFDKPTDLTWDYISNPQTIYNIFAVIFTLAISVHDWYSFHREHTEKPRSFLNYFVQALSIFFIGQMFSAANYSLIHYWFLFGACYVICNIIRASCLEKQKIDKWSYMLLHLVIAFIGSLPIFWKGASLTNYDKTGYGILTIIVISIMWCYRDKKFNEQNKEGSITVSADNVSKGSYSLLFKGFNFDTTNLNKFIILSIYNESAEDLKNRFPELTTYIDLVKAKQEEALTAEKKQIIREMFS